MRVETSHAGSDARRRASARQRQALRALKRQLAYQERKALRAKGHEDAYIAAMSQSSARVHAKAEAAGARIAEDARVLEVGSGAHGLIFYFGARRGVGVDPLAAHYARLFPAWQGRVPVVAAFGEALPFSDSTFDVVLCDNVIDHAEDPAQIVSELARVLRPGGLLYFTVNVHHPVYSAAAAAHRTLNAARIPIEVGPFADHTVHLTLAQARRMFDGLPLNFISESCGIDEAKALARQRPPRHLGDRLKRLFFKNALYEIIATKERQK